MVALTEGHLEIVDYYVMTVEAHTFARGTFKLSFDTCLVHSGMQLFP